MISYLSGTVREMGQSSVLIIVNNIGFEINVPEKYIFHKNEIAKLEVHFYFHQENGPQLFGFKTIDEKKIFALILSCSGVGPKLALAALNILSPADFISAVLSNDIKTLSSIDGVGKKKAESIVLQLKDKVQKISLSQSAGKTEVANVLKNLTGVLESLGYSRAEVFKTVEHLKTLKALSTDVPFDSIIKKALAFASKNKKNFKFN